jgi:hypothetical protein
MACIDCHKDELYQKERAGSTTRRMPRHAAIPSGTMLWDGSFATGFWGWLLPEIKSSIWKYACGFDGSFVMIYRAHFFLLASTVRCQPNC